jgi:hypothetical protein
MAAGVLDNMHAAFLVTAARRSALWIKSIWHFSCKVPPAVLRRNVRLLSLKNGRPKMQNWIRVLICALALSLGACASLPEGAQPLKASADLDKNAKQFPTKADKAMVYIYRNNFVGRALPLVITLNDKVVGGLPGYSYFAMELPPGNYSVKSKMETETEVKLDAKAGQSYYLWLDLSMGVWSGRPSLYVKTDQEAQKAIKEECELAIPQGLPAALAAK